MRRTLICALASLLILATYGSLVLGQVTSTGSLSGTVTDPTGAVVANASVTITNAATNQEFTAQTNDSGAFNVPSLTTGLYTAVITAPGFKKAEITGIKIDASKPSDINIALEIGAPTETAVL